MYINVVKCCQLDPEIQAQARLQQQTNDLHIAHMRCIMQRRDTFQGGA
jgi:hypothetical protein